MGNYNSSYLGQCGNCEEFEFKSKWEKGYCRWYRCYYHADDSCSHQKDIKKESSLCYITTIICKKLGLDDNCDTLNSLRKLRNDIMIPNEKYHILLAEYDIIGPVIANKIAEDQDTEQMLWENVYDCYLDKTAKYVENQQEDKAINKYIEMINSLKTYYSIYDEVTELPKNYDISKSGHGKVKTLSNDKQI